MTSLDMQEKQSLFFYMLTLVTVLALIIAGPIHQDCSYHNFADSRNIFGVPNFYNVISNASFLFIGMWGLYKVYSFVLSSFNKAAYYIFSIGIIFTGIGSAYYHWAPTSERLVWDRLPMTIAFMSFFAIILSAYFSRKWEYLILTVLLISGLLSVLYWYVGDAKGEGDLRPYIFVQYYPLIIVTISLVVSSASPLPKKVLAISFLFYFLAKIFEMTDGQIFDIGKVISGHTLKHLAASAASLAIIWTCNKERQRRKMF